MGFEAPVSYENTWEGWEVVGGGVEGGGGREGWALARVKHPHTYEGLCVDRHLL